MEQRFLVTGLLVDHKTHLAAQLSVKLVYNMRIKANGH